MLSVVLSKDSLESAGAVCISVEIVLWETHASRD